MNPHPASRPQPLLRKLLLAVSALALGLLGVIGLLVPVLPGLLFLAAAAGCLCLASRRCNAYFQRHIERHPRHRETLGHWRAGAALPPWQRLKLAGLLAARSVLPGQQRH